VTGADRDEPPDIAGEIIGFRSWIVEEANTSGPVRLTSLTTSTRWPTGEWLRATCDRCPLELVPNPDCTCGVYAARHSPHLHRLGYHQEETWFSGYRGAIVVGEVAMAGRVIEGTQGWRAEKARPFRLWVPHAQWRLVSRLERAYDVPVALANIYEEDV